MAEEKRPSIKDLNLEPSVDLLDTLDMRLLLIIPRPSRFFTKVFSFAESEAKLPLFLNIFSCILVVISSTALAPEYVAPGFLPSKSN